MICEERRWGKLVRQAPRLYPVRGVVLDQELDRESAERSHGKTQNFMYTAKFEMPTGNEFRALFQLDPTHGPSM